VFTAVDIKALELARKDSLDVLEDVEHLAPYQAFRLGEYSVGEEIMDSLDLDVIDRLKLTFVEGGATRVATGAVSISVEISKSSTARSREKGGT
jgi:hypothetical protein